MKDLKDFLTESLISEAGGAKIKNKEYNNVARVYNYLEMAKPMFIDRVMAGKAFKCSDLFRKDEREAKKLVDEIEAATGVQCTIKAMNAGWDLGKRYFILIPAATDKEDIMFEYIKIFDRSVGDWKVIHA